MQLTYTLPSGLKKKTILPVLLILIISMACVAAFNYFSQISVLQTEADESVTSAINTAQGFIESHLNLYKQMATLLANNPAVGEAVSNNDRSRLLQEYLEPYKALKKGVHLNQMNFHRPPGVTLVRMQNPDDFGDNLAQVRHTISDVYKNRTGVKGLEFGRTGLGLRGVEPIFAKGTFVGSLEFGGDLAPALDDAKRAFGVECGILISKNATAVAKSMPEWQGAAKPIGEYLSFYSTDQVLTMGLLTPEIIAKAAKDGSDRYMDTGGFQSKSYSIGFTPLKDYAGNSIGFLYVLKDRSLVLAKIYKSLAINVVVFLAILLAIASAISSSLNKTVISPVVRLANVTNDISKGKMGEKIEIASGDEIEVLAKSIDRLRVSMKMFLN